MQDLKHIQAYIKSLFCARKIPNVQLAGKLKNFIENWKILTNDTEILSLVEGYKNTISRNSLSEKHPKLSQIMSETKGSSTERNSRDVEQGSHYRGSKALGREI